MYTGVSLPIALTSLQVFSVVSSTERFPHTQQIATTSSSSDCKAAIIATASSEPVSTSSITFFGFVFSDIIFSSYISIYFLANTPLSYGCFIFLISDT